MQSSPSRRGRPVSSGVANWFARVRCARSLSCRAIAQALTDRGVPTYPHAVRRWELRQAAPREQRRSLLAEILGVDRERIDAFFGGPLHA